MAFVIRAQSYLFLLPVSAKFTGPSDRQNKYVIGPICLIPSRTKMSDVASNTIYTMYTQSQTDISSVLWNDSPNKTECPMKFHKVSRTLYSSNLQMPPWKQVTRLLCPRVNACKIHNLDRSSLSLFMGTSSLWGHPVVSICGDISKNRHIAAYGKGANNSFIVYARKTAKSYVM